jgi:hypothetical protein
MIVIAALILVLNIILLDVMTEMKVKHHIEIIENFTET